MPPVSRATVTGPSRIMLPVYPVLALGLGVFFLLQSPSRTSSEVFDVAKMLLSIHGWGFVFLALGVLEVAAMLLGEWEASRQVIDTRSRPLYQRALQLGAGLAAFWMVLLEGAALNSPNVSFTSGWWLIVVVSAHIASARSLAEGSR